MKIIICPKCGASTIALIDNGYLCLKCNYEFNNHTNPYHKMVTLDYTIKKSLAFPKLNIAVANEDIFSRCLFDTIPDSLDCDNIDCDGCIFSKENYKMFTDVKEEKKENN